MSALPRCGIAVLLLAGCSLPDRTDFSHPVDARSRAALAAQIDTLAAASLQQGPIAGLSITVLHGPDVLISRGYGVADVTQPAATTATAATSYRIGSVSKLITAIAVLRLVERGAITLDSPVGRILPGAPVDSRLTVRHLLNHTSALPDHEQAAVERWLRERLPITHEYVLQVVGQRTDGKAPGTAWRYASSPYHLAGMVIEKVAGIPYEDFIRRELAAPLGLESLRLCSGRAPLPGEAADYLATERGFEPDVTWQVPGIFSAGGLCASAPDVARLLRSFGTAQVVSARWRDTMLAPTAAGGVSADYGLGVMLGRLGTEAKWGHTGGGAHSNRSAAAYYPGPDVTIVVLMNTERDDSQTTAMTLETRIARAVLRLPPPDGEASALDHPTSRYTGRYGEGPGLSEIRAQGAQLTYQRLAGSAEPTVMRYAGADEFVPFADTPEFRFRFQVAGDRAVALAIYEGGWFRGVRAKVP